ncbi:unnamed protein product [Dicrocoelium dendriticum]|nr:unnamed protein product [Dicrocoelium dendriticum]
MDPEVCATLGTTSCCSFDNLVSLGPVCHSYNLWLHIDAAYAGSALICPEFQYLANGIEYACSINSNPNKWMLVGFDCSLMWVRDRQALTSSMAVDPIYLQHKHSSKAIDFRHWGIPLSRRFRSLKLWFVMRAYGASGLRSYIRNHVALARLFAQNIRTDDRFELVGDALLGLVCFRLKGSNALNQLLTRAINESLRLHVVPGVVKDLYFIRFAICRENATSVDVEKAWHWIKQLALEILAAKEALDSWYGRLSTRFKEPLELDDTSLENLYPSEHSDDEEQNEFEADHESVHMSKLETELASFAKYRLDKLLEVGETEAHRTLLHYLQRLGWDTSRLLRRGDANSDGPQDAPWEVHNSLGTVPGSSEVKNGLDLISRIQNFTLQVHSKPCVRKTRRRTQSADFSGSLQKHDGHEFRGLMHRTQTFSSAIIHGESRNPSPSRLSPSDNIPKSAWVTSHSFAVPEQIPSAIPLHWKVPELPHTACGTVHTGFRRLTSMRAFQNECDAQGPRISERDLGVGAIHTKTLTKLRRHSLIRMLADPICLDESGQTDCTSERYKDGNIASRSWRYKVMEFNRMLKSFEYAKSNEPNRSTI